MDEEAGERDASQLNRELTQLLVESGKQMGFNVQVEWPVPGGRLDVVWTWTPPSPIPGLDISLPVVAFEIESSWRTRKHVKGDLLNIQDAGVALGVIVLAGADPRDDSLRRFARTLVDRPGARVLIWTEDDVRALAAGEATLTVIEAVTSAVATATAPPTTGTGERAHSGKYRLLWEWLREQERRDITVTFTDVERVLGFRLPDSCRNHVPHWHSYEGSAVARAIIDAGWRAHHVQLAAGTVTFSPGTTSH